MSAKLLEQRCGAYRACMRRADLFRSFVERLTAGNPLQAVVDLEGMQDGQSYPVPSIFLLPYFRGELEYAEKQIAAFEAAAAPILALDSEGFPR